MIFNKSYQRLTVSTEGTRTLHIKIDVRAVPSAKVGSNVYGSWIELTDHFGTKVSHMLREWDPEIATCEPDFLKMMKRHHDLYKLGAFQPIGEGHQDFDGVRVLSAAIGELEAGHYNTHDRIWHQIPIKGNHGDFIWEQDLAGRIATVRRKHNGSVFITEVSFKRINYKYSHPSNEDFDPNTFLSVVEKVRFATLDAKPISVADLELIYSRLHS